MWLIGDWNCVRFHVTFFPLQKLSLKELLMEKKKNSAKHGVHRFRQAATVVLATCR